MGEDEQVVAAQDQLQRAFGHIDAAERLARGVIDEDLPVGDE